MKDHKNIIEAAQLIAPEVLDADNTPASIDLDGFDAANIYIHVGAGGITFTSTNKVEFKLTESDDDSTFSAVADDDVVGCTVGTGGIIKSLVAAHAAVTLSEFAYKGSKRYLKLLADFGGTHSTGTAMSAFAIKALPFVSQ